MLGNVQRQIVWNRLLSIVEEQAQTLMRTAFSTVVREAGDLSAGVFDCSGRMLAQAVTGTPGHVNAMALAVGHFLDAYPLSDMRSGDVFLSNNPWLMTGHLNDFTVVTPVFFLERPVALFASTSHIADVGGRGFGPDAHEVFEEGIHIPILPMFREGKRDETLMTLITANVRDPVVAEGDLYSLAACNDKGKQQLLHLMEEFSLDGLEDVSDHICKSSLSAMEDEIHELPRGTYAYAMDVDGYDQPVHIDCQLTIHDRHVEVSFDGTSPVSEFGINVPLNYTQAYATFGVRCLVGRDVPNNVGSLSSVRVTAPEGSILNALPPCAVSARHALGQMLPDVVIGCLAQVVPERVLAEGASCIWNPVLMSTGGSQGNLENRRFVINPIFNGGTGARNGKDGLSTTAFPSGVRTTSTEVNEVTSPLHFWRREFRTNSGGEGQYRGGLGQVIEVAHAEGAPFVISKMFERVGHPARGRFGGGDGAPGRVYLKDGEALRAKGRDVVPAGATLVMETPGGGGLGKPEAREASAIERDRRAGLLDEP
ncbi:MAG: hydantoinase B/oxoprolinase family protein [Pseudomonadales bacterium]|nr:hydantoinase B/oxoprolinase family protein [Pseudomonadales bacterium]